VSATISGSVLSSRPVLDRLAKHPGAKRSGRARCTVSIRSDPAKSAIVRASFKMRWYARALICNCCIAAFNRLLPAGSTWQKSRTSAGPTLAPALQVQVCRRCRSGWCPRSGATATGGSPAQPPPARGSPPTARLAGHPTAFRTQPAAPRRALRVDPVQQRAGDPLLVAGDPGRRAGTLFDRITEKTTRAGIVTKPNFCWLSKGFPS
jgi:hypothetical protein